MTTEFRVGQGVDVHRFAADSGPTLKLGGVAFGGEPGLAGHSDSDVVLHAVVDALLGAAGLGDIGTLFGAEDPAYAGADSRLFVDGALARVRAAGWSVGNLDITIVAQRPRLGPRRGEIVTSIAAMLGISADAVSVKATTTDGLGFTGRGEGVACLATALLSRAAL